MVQLEALPTYDELLAQGPEKLLAFIEDTWPATGSREDKFMHWNFWSGLAEAAVWKTFVPRINPQVINLLWAKVALEVYERLSQQYTDHVKTCSLMAFKAELILTVGSEIDASLANIDEIIAWFYANLTLSLDEAYGLLPLARSNRSKIDKIQRDRILELTNLLDRLEIIRGLRQNDRFIPDETLDRWIQLGEQI